MKISILLKTMIVCLIVLSVSAFSCLYFLKASIDESKNATEKQIEFKDLVQDLSNSSDYLTNQVREYVQFGERVHFDNYWREVNETKTRDHVVERLKELNTPTELLSLVEQAKNNSDALINLEDKAMKAVENGEMEAARAGEHGKGFSIVADEVRKLAEQSAESARQISQLVTDIQKETLLVVESMEKGTIKVKAGIEKTEQVTGAFMEIENSVYRVSGNTQEVSATIQQLAAGSQQIVHSIQMVKGATKTIAAMNERNSASTQEQLATMEEIRTSAEVLSNLAENLQEDASKFTL